MRVAINGFGRIGRSVFRILDKRANAELVAINDVFDHAALRYLLNYDTVMGRFEGALQLEGDELVTSRGRTRMLQKRNLSSCRGASSTVDVVIESTGIFTSREQLSQTSGSRRQARHSAPCRQKTRSITPSSSASTTTGSSRSTG